jgi:hypothetical protein
MGQTKRNHFARILHATLINSRVVRLVVAFLKLGNVTRITIVALVTLQTSTMAAPIRNVAWTNSLAPVKCVYHLILFAIVTTTAGMGLMKKIVNICASLLNITTVLPTTNACLLPLSAMALSNAALEKTNQIVRPSLNMDANPTSMTAEMELAFLPS